MIFFVITTLGEAKVLKHSGTYPNMMSLNCLKIVSLSENFQNLWTGVAGFKKQKTFPSDCFSMEKFLSFSCSLSTFVLLFVAFGNAVKTSCWLEFDWIWNGILISYVTAPGFRNADSAVVEFNLILIFSSSFDDRNLCDFNPSCFVKCLSTLKADWHQLPLLLDT